MRPIDLEARLLSSVRTLDDVSLAEDQGVTAETFLTTDPVDHGAVWEYLRDHARRLAGELPTDADLLSLHGFERSGAGDLATYVGLAREAEKARRARGILIRHSEALSGEAGADDAISFIIGELTELGATRGRRVSFFDRDAGQRLKRFKEARGLAKSGAIIGIPTGLDVFDRQRLGFRAGELVVTLASTGVGKSWLSMYMATVAYDAGRRVVVLSPELSRHEMEARFDSLLGALRGVNLSNLAIATGDTDRLAIAEYRAWLKSLTGRADLAIIDGGELGKQLGFEDAWRYVAEFRPDVLVLDGTQLLVPLPASRGRAGWEVLKDGMAFLKAMAQQEGVVVIAAHQVTRQAARRDATRMPDLSETGYGINVVESANRVIALARTGNERERAYRVLKWRDGPEMPMARLLEWDVDLGVIRERKEAPRWQSEGDDEF